MPERDGHLVVAIQYDAQAFNDAYRYYTGHGGYFVCNNIYSRLVVLDVFESGMIAPDLAERWESPDNGQTWRFYLNPRARWHDGVPVTAHDVAHTYTTVLARGYAGKTFLSDIDTTTVLDDHTVEIRLHAPNAAFLAQLGSFVLTHIVPKHLFPGDDWDGNPHNLQPVGSGPFRFKAWHPGDRIELDANPDYWREGPYVETLTYRVMPDIEEALTAVRNGEVHFVTRDVPCARIEEVGEWPGVEIMAIDGHSMGNVSFNWTQPLFQDRRVREAIARAIDRRPIATQVCPLATTPTHYYLPAVDWAFDETAVAPDFDPARAAELLDEAGHLPDTDGVRLRLRMGYRTIYPHYGLSAQIMATQLRDIGIVLEIEGADPLRWGEGYLRDGDFDLLLEAGDIGPDPQIMASYLTSGDTRNVSRYGNPAVDAAFVAGRGTTDLAERGKHYKRLQQELARDIARVPFLRHGEHLPYRSEFTGWSWSNGVRGTVPFWYHGLVRRSDVADATGLAAD